MILGTPLIAILKHYYLFIFEEEENAADRLQTKILFVQRYVNIHDQIHHGQQHLNMCFKKQRWFSYLLLKGVGGPLEFTRPNCYIDEESLKIDTHHQASHIEPHNK